jgi:hypothetical protein
MTNPLDDADEPFALTPDAAPEPGPAVPSAIDAIIDRWFVDTFHNRGFDVDLFNSFTQAKSNLKQQIAAVMAGKDV